MNAVRAIEAPHAQVLMPGDIVCGDRGERLETLLGSCVAVVLTDKHRTVGAMCHIVHAGAANGKSENPQAHAATAIDTMYRMLSARGYTPQLCEAFVYGGGNMFPGLVDGVHVGEKNSHAVLERLQRDRVRLLHQDLGGTAYRRLSWIVGHDWPVVSAVPVMSECS